MQEPKDVTLLIVDDEEGLRRALAFDFKRRGFNVLEAGSGNDAFEIIKKNKVHVVLSDVRMPNGDGVGLLNNIKKVHPELPVVMFITGFADLTLEDAYDLGADAIFSKPFDRKAVIAKVIDATKTREDLWGSRKDERVETSLNIDLTFSELNGAIKGKVLNLGRGGMFVAMTGNLPSVSSPISFTIGFSQGSISGIHGHGIVRWTRMQLTDDRPAGCGIEFVSLEDSVRKQLIDYIVSLKTRSFIPKT